MMLETRNITFSYSKDPTIARVLDDISIQFQPGVFYSIFGPSGSGKTTFLSVLGGLEKPNSGSVWIDEESIEKAGETEVRRKYVSYVFQNYLLFPYLTAIENVIVAMDICGIQSGDKRKRATDILLSLGLEERTFPAGSGSSPGGSSSASRLQERSLPKPGMSWRTNPPAIWTKKRPSG